MSTRIIITTFALLLVALGLAHAQIPEHSYLRFNHDDSGAVRDYALLAGVPTLGGSAQILSQGGLSQYGNQLRVDGSFQSHCATNRQLAIFSNSWTIEFWFYDERPLTDTTLGYLLGTEFSSGLRLQRGGSAGPGDLILRAPGLDLTIPGAAPSHTWTHISILYGADMTSPTIDVVVNGSHVIGTLVSPGFGITTGPLGLTIGSRGGFNGFDGWIDEFRYWDSFAFPSQTQIAVADAFPHHEDFDGHAAPGAINTTDVPAGWTQVDELGAGNPQWVTQLGPTSSLNTGPDAGHVRGGYYCYVEDSNADDSATILETPWIDLALTANPYLRFWCHSNNASISMFENSLSVIVDPRGMPPTTLNPVIGDLDADWMLMTYDLSVFAGELVKVRFVVNNDNGNFTHDIAIDDFAVVDGIDTGVPADFARASLDINGARTAATTPFAAGLPVEFEAEGPYYSTVYGATQNLLLEVNGTPNQAIVMFFGQLDVTPPFLLGGLNIGTGNGIDGVSLFADGNQGTFPGMLFRTNVNGRFQMNIPAFGIPPLTTAFQAVVWTGDSSIIAFSNAIEVTFL